MHSMFRPGRVILGRASRGVDTSQDSLPSSQGSLLVITRTVTELPGLAIRTKSVGRKKQPQTQPEANGKEF